MLSRRLFERVTGWIGETHAGIVILALTAASVSGSVVLCQLAYHLCGLDVAWSSPAGPAANLMPILAPLVMAPLISFPIVRAVRHNMHLLVELRLVRSRLEGEVQVRRELQQALEDQAVRDTLTGLLNRRGFFSAVQARSFGDKATQTVLVIDVDGLKPVNDTYGHASGDVLLRSVARAIGAALGPEAITARLGGDEFAAVVHGTAADLVTAVDRAVANIDLELPAGAPRRASVSIGSAELAHGDSIDAILAVADERMYEQKRRSVSSRA